MTDVARRRRVSSHVKPHAADAEFSRDRHKHRSRKAAGNSEQERLSKWSRYEKDGSSHDYPQDLEILMDVIIQPPKRARATIPLSPSIMVRLRSHSPCTFDENEAPEMNELYAVVQLVSNDGKTSPEALQRTLAGSLCESIHPFAEENTTFAKSRGLGYVSFADLKINAEGSYRLRVSLLRVTHNGGMGQSQVIRVVESDPIKVAGV